MNNYRILFLPVCLSVSLAAQDISVDFTKNPDIPLVVANPSTGRTLFFFYPEKLRSDDFEKDGNSCRAYELNSATLEVMRSSPELALHIPGGNELDIRVLGRFCRGADYYLVLENNNEIQVLRIAGKDLTMQRTDTYQVDETDRVIQGTADSSNAYVLCSQKVKKGDDLLLVFRVDENGKLEKHVFPVGEKHEKTVSNMLKGNFRPLSVEYGIEKDPELASKKAKLFAVGGQLLVTFDYAREKLNAGGPDVPVLGVVAFDLAAEKISYRTFPYADNLIADPAREARNSFIFEEKIFQLYLDSEQFLLRVRDLQSGESLFSKILMREDTIAGIANSPILVPGGGIFGVEKEYRSVGRFARRFARFDPFMQVRRVGNDYLMCIGGHEEVNQQSFGTLNPATGMMSPGGWYGSYERSFSFYSAIDARTMTRSDVFFKKTVSGAYFNLVNVIVPPRDHGLFRVGERFFLGYHDKGARTYRLKELKVEMR